MTPERVVVLVARWVRFYTRNLPAPSAQRRTDEIAADLHDHTAHERQLGVSDRRIALHILSRMVRGVTADASWRRQVRAQRGSLMKLVLVVVTAVIVVALGVAAVVFGEADDSPGLQGLGVLLVIGAVAFSVRTVRANR